MGGVSPPKPAQNWTHEVPRCARRLSPPGPPHGLSRWPAKLCLSAREGMGGPGRAWPGASLSLRPRGTSPDGSPPTGKHTNKPTNSFFLFSSPGRGGILSRALGIFSDTREGLQRSLSCPRWRVWDEQLGSALAPNAPFPEKGEAPGQAARSPGAAPFSRARGPYLGRDGPAGARPARLQAHTCCRTS